MGMAWRREGGCIMMEPENIRACVALVLVVLGFLFS